MARSIRRAVPVMAAVAVAALGFAVAGSASVPFAITHLDFPLFVKQNGPRTSRSISWQGNPTFPVTVHERGLCPESINCGPRTGDGFGQVGTTVFTTRADPLVTPNHYYCTGSQTANYLLGIEVWLTDAKGHRTPRVRNFWVCNTH